MAKEKLITATQLKKSLSDYTQNDLVTLVTEIAQACPQAKEFLTVKFAARDNISDVLEKYKAKVRNEFYPKRGFGRLNLREAKKAISDFKKICNDKVMIVDIMLYYVENCVEFTNDYGDINESFYVSADSVYGSVVKEINVGDKALYDIYAERLRNTAENACEGWGFKDDLMAQYDEIIWLDADSDDL